MPTLCVSCVLDRENDHTARGIPFPVTPGRKPIGGNFSYRPAAGSVSYFEDVHVGHDQDLLQRQFRAVNTPHLAPITAVDPAISQH
jgi:hypothetical protein